MDFRILASKGVVAAVDPAMAQEMNGGLTHTAESNGVRTWDFEWTAPADDSKFVDFKIYGNAVNGGNGFNGDMWNSLMRPQLQDSLLVKWLQALEHWFSYLPQ